MEGVAARRPQVALYENTAGLWKRPEMRARVESILCGIGSAYEWEAMPVSPHEHAAFPARRPRVFYVGVRRETRRCEAASL